MENNTPNPLTAAIEEAVKNFKKTTYLPPMIPEFNYTEAELIAYKQHRTKAAYLEEILVRAMQQAHALGKQEGMETVVAHIAERGCILANVTNPEQMLESSGWLTGHSPEALTTTSARFAGQIIEAHTLWLLCKSLIRAARTAHRGDSGK